MAGYNASRGQTETAFGVRWHEKLGDFARE